MDGPGGGWLPPPPDSPHCFRLRRYGRRNFRPKTFSTEQIFGQIFFRLRIFRPNIFSVEKLFGRTFFRPNFFRSFFFCRGGLGGRSPPSFNHFKKFARRANFLKCCRGGVWGGEAPLRNLRYPCLAPVPCPQFTRTIYAYDL